MISFTRTASLPASLRSKLNQYIEEEFGHIPFVQQRSWASPDWTVVLEEEGEVATFVMWWSVPLRLTGNLIRRLVSTV